MTEGDWPIEQGVSVLDRPATDGDSPPEVSASELPGVEFASFRLALVDDDRRVYIARRGDDDLFVLFFDAEGGSGSEGLRSTLAERGAIVTWNSVPGDRFIAAGIVADPVTAVRVGEIPAPLRDNAFAVVMPLGASDELIVSLLTESDRSRGRRLGSSADCPLAGQYVARDRQIGAESLPSARRFRRPRDSLAKRRLMPWAHIHPWRAARAGSGRTCWRMLRHLKGPNGAWSATQHAASDALPPEEDQ